MGKKRKCFFANKQATKKSVFKFGNSIKLGPDLKGYLITYNCKFTFCLNEAKKILQQFSISSNQEKDDESSGGDIEKQMQKELDSLNSTDKEYTAIETGAKYTLFINQANADPNQVAYSIYEYIESTKKPIGRFVQRLLPVLNTCKAHLDEIEKCLKITLDNLDVFKDDKPPIKYSCIFKASNNGSLSREDIFKITGSYFQSKNKLNKVDFDSPDHVLLINVICNVCFISFVENYFKYRKYNLIEMGAKYTGVSSQKKTEKSEEKNKNIEDSQPASTTSTPTTATATTITTTTTSVTKEHENEIVKKKKRLIINQYQRLSNSNEYKNLSE